MRMAETFQFLLDPWDLFTAWKLLCPVALWLIMNGLLGVFLGNANLGSQRRFSAASFGICLYVFMVAGWKIPGRNGAFNGQIIKLNGLFSTKPCLTPPPAGEKSRHRRPVLLPFTTTEAYKFRLGDVNFHQSCRLKAKVYRPMSSLAGRQLSRQKLGFSVGVCWENRGWKPWSCQAFFFSGFKPAFPVFLLPVSSISEGKQVGKQGIAIQSMLAWVFFVPTREWLKMV